MGVNTSSFVAPIASGSSLSAGINLGDKNLVALIMPAAWDAADVTFQTSYDYGATWTDLIDVTKSEIKIATPTAGKAIQLNASDFIACVFLKVRSGTSAAPVNQTANRTIGIFGRKLYPR